MGKNIKKIFKYLVIFSGIILMIPTILYLVLQVPEVQTFLIARVSAYLSNETKTTISVGRVEYKFFNRLSVNDLLIKDRNNDTLVFSSELTAGLRQLDLKNKSVSLGRIILEKPVIGLVTDTTGMLNLSYFLEYLKKPADTASKAKTYLFIDEVDINDARFSFINRAASKSKSPVDFNNIKITGLNGVIDDFTTRDDTIRFDIYNLGFAESSGFILNRMSSSVMLANQNILFSDLNLDCDSSIINIPRLALMPENSSSFKKFTDEVKLDVLLDKSLISTSDLRYFISSLSGIDESVWFSGRVFGTIAELRGRDIEVSLRNYTNMECDFDLSGLPKIENTFMYLGINSLRTNAKDIEQIRLPGGKINIPEFLYKLENISFDGSFTGFTTDFVTYGEIRTNLGTIRTDVSLRPDSSSSYKIKGLITGNGIDLGALTGKPDLLGELTIHSIIDGSAKSINKLSGSLAGKIDSVEINKYLYRNVSLNGTFTEKAWDGTVNINDRNIRLDLLGMFNFEDTLPEFHFTLNLADANLFALNLEKADSSSNLSALVTSNFKGNNIDNLDGEIKLINSTLKRNDEALELYDFSIRTFTENSKPVLSLNTDFVDAEIRGYYNFAQLGTLIKSTLSTLMPSRISPPDTKNEPGKNNFNFNIWFKNTDKINSFFRTGILLADKSYISGTVIADSIITVQGRSKMLSVKNNTFTDFAFDAGFIDHQLSISLGTPSLSIMNQTLLKDFSVKLNAVPDNFVFSVDWDNKEQILNRGNFTARGLIARNDLKQNATIFIDIDSSDIYLNDNRWKVSKSSMLIDTSAVKINKLRISSGVRSYMVDGSVSEDPYDTLKLDFRGIDIAPLNYIGNKTTVSADRIPLDLKGMLNGKILLTNVHRDMLAEGNLVLNDFSIFGGKYGNITIISAWDKQNKVARINVNNDLDGMNMFNAGGFYEPRGKKVNIAANTKRLPMEFLNPLLRVFASDIRGLASGKVTLSGNIGNLVLQGSVFAEDASMKINYLQTRYKLNDSIRFDKKGFKFNNIRLTDEKGNFASLNGAVNHRNFKDFKVDLLINVNKALVLNTKPKDNDVFYGTAYATGVTTIKSVANSLVFDISAKTEANTNFFIPLNRGLSVSENSFITFIDSAQIKAEEEHSGDKNTTQSRQTGMDINFDLEVTPDAQVQLVFDSKVGDVMKGRGSGNLNMGYNQKGEFKISGDYIIEQGDYLFTLGNILNKSFDVENGGKITFNGDIDNAEVDINAIYKLRTSLDKILQDSSLKERIPVECHLNLTGKLFNPIVTFDISLPTADEQTKTNLRNAISTEEALSRQFLYLLVMNSFYADPSYGTPGASTTATGTSAMAVTTTEMLSNQLSNWLSQISNNVDLGFVYRPGNKELNPQELEIALSTQILNDKITINGNFDVRGNADNIENTDQITGDFDAELSLTEKIRLKVFNRFNSTSQGKGPYTQGIGIFFREEFNKFSDLFRKKEKDEMKKEKEVRLK